MVEGLGMAILVTMEKRLGMVIDQVFQDTKLIVSVEFYSEDGLEMTLLQ